MEETMNLDFDLGSGNKYVDTGSIQGRVLVDFELNRSPLIDRLDRLESPSIMDKVNLFLEDWSLDGINRNEIRLNYGQLLFRGAEPMDMDPTIPLGGTFDRNTLRQTSPEDLKRNLRTERNYETTYEDLAEEVAAYLDREGIVANPSFSAPIHIQAKANPAVKGTNFTLTLKNNERWPIHTVTVKVEMPPEVGREVEIGHWIPDDDDAGTQSGHIESTASGVSGSYDPEENTFDFDVDGLSESGEGNAEREIHFHVPARSQRDLSTVAGEAQFTRDQPFSNLMPVAVFDAGGHRLDGNSVGINATGHVKASFSTPTADITVSSVQETRKEFQVKGVLPEEAITEIEELLKERGVSGTEVRTPEEKRNMRDGKEVVKLKGGIKNGSILVGDTRIEINVDVSGDVRTANRETSRETGENLPAERRSVATEYGRTGVTVRGKGTDQQVVDEYITDLRDELHVTLKSLSEEM
jgi:hypothetical protein